MYINLLVTDDMKYIKQSSVSTYAHFNFSETTWRTDIKHGAINDHPEMSIYIREIVAS